MSAVNRFHQVANDALVMISENLQPGAKLALVIYTSGQPELDIVLKDGSLDVEEVVNTLRRRGGLSLDGDNDYKRGICDVIVGSLGAGKQNNNRPPEGHWAQRFWELGRAEGEQRDELVAALEHLVLVTTPDASGQIGAEEEHLASLKNARDLIRLHRA